MEDEGDKLYREINRIASKSVQRLDEDRQLSEEEFLAETEELSDLGFSPIDVDRYSGPMRPLVAAMHAFHAYVTTSCCGRASEDDVYMEMRAFASRQYQLDHSLAVSNGIKAAVTAFSRYLKDYEPQVHRNDQSIWITWRKK